MKRNVGVLWAIVVVGTWSLAGSGRGSHAAENSKPAQRIDEDSQSLIDALNASESNVRDSAAERLERAGPSLLAALETPESKVRYTALVAIAELVQKPETSQNSVKRNSFVRALRKLLEDKEPCIAHGALINLRCMGTEGEQAVAEFLRQGKEELLHKLRSRTLSPPTGSGPFVIRGGDLSASAPTDEGEKGTKHIWSFFVFLQCLDASDYCHRANAALNLGSLAKDSPESVQELARVFEQKLSLVDLMAAASLLGERPRAVSELSPESIMVGVLYLGAKAEPIVATVARRNASAPWYTRHTVVRGLRLMGSDGTTQPLTRALADEHFIVRRAAADALRVLGPRAESALPFLKTALQDPSPNVRRAAASAIKAIDAGQRLEQ